MSSPRLTVREMRLDEVALRIDYFHDASDQHLLRLGVDRARLPSKEAWQTDYEADCQRPLPARVNYSIVWERDHQVVGFSTTDKIRFGVDAFMHLHILDARNRQAGMGAEFVKLSAATYFDVLELRRLYCQPNAFNIAPNRSLQRAGFRYEFTHEDAPSEINFLQPVTRWVLDNPMAVHGRDR
jgi:RimJ/RimL family protein N-acetyltransferase